MMQSIETRYRNAILGGSFDPIHLGHINLFHLVAEKHLFSNLLVIPALKSNFKRDSIPALYSDRLEMVRLACLDYRELYPADQLKLELSSYESESGEISYTSLTVKHYFPLLSEQGKVNLIIGDDHLAKLENWHDWTYLRSHVRFFVFSREGGEEKGAKIDAELHYIDNEIYTASSTDIRDGDRSMLSSRVRRYIDEHHLYRSL